MMLRESVQGALTTTDIYTPKQSPKYKRKNWCRGGRNRQFNNSQNPQYCTLNNG